MLFASSLVRCDLNIRSNNSTPVDVVFFFCPMLVLGVRNIGCFESWVLFFNKFVKFVVFDAVCEICLCCAGWEKM